MRQRQPHRPKHGYTLIEVMIVVAVLAILSLIAWPAYTDQVRKSRRAEAVSLLNRLAQEQERHRATNPSYAASVPALFASASAPTSPFYVLSIASAASSAYALTATAVGAQATDSQCSSLTFFMQGGNATYLHTGTATANQCWNRR